MSKTDCTLSVNEWLEHLDFNPDTGVFIWKTTWGKRKKGNEAGTVQKTGYRMIGLFGRRIYSHRLAWIVVNGDLADKCIDHINGNKLDNRIANLRLANASENAQNVKKSKVNTTGFRGVSFYKARNKFVAEPKIYGKKYFLGYFDTPEEASSAYIKKKTEMASFFNPART